MSDPALEALHTKIRMTETWNSDRGRAYAGALAEITQARMEPRYTPGGLPGAQESPAPFAAAMARRLDFATAFWVSEEMVDLTVLASESRPLDPMHIEDVPAQHGFAVFQHGARLHFSAGEGGHESLTIKALLWDQTLSAEGQPGISVTFWSDARDQRDTMAGLLAVNATRWPKVTEATKAISDLYGLATIEDAERDAQPANGTTLHRGVDPFEPFGSLVVSQVAFIPFGQQFEEQYWWAALPSTFFNLMSQPITARTPGTPDKLALKQAKRAKVMASTVSIITLRRAKSPKSEDGPAVDPDAPRRKLSVRTMVGERTGGFWRRQPTSEGVKILWISPFWRGPEDAPIAFRRDKVYAWRR